MTRLTLTDAASLRSGSATGGNLTPTSSNQKRPPASRPPALLRGSREAPIKLLSTTGSLVLSSDTSPLVEGDSWGSSTIRAVAQRRLEPLSPDYIDVAASSSYNNDPSAGKPTWIQNRQNCIQSTSVGSTTSAVFAPDQHTKRDQRTYGHESQVSD
jgi:hypothetical protein